MAIGTHITLPTTPYGQKAQSVMASLQSTVEQLRQLKKIADSYTSGGTVAANLENVAIGFPAGDGQAFYTDLTNILATVDVATVTTGVAKYIG